MKKCKLSFLTVMLALMAVTGVFASLTFPDLDSIRPIRQVRHFDKLSAGKAQGKPIQIAQDNGPKNVSGYRSIGVSETTDNGPKNVSGYRSIGVSETTDNGQSRHGEESSLPKFSIWRSAGAVIFVLGALLAVNGFLRKRQGFSLKSGEKRSIKMLEKLTIDTRRSLLLVEVNGKKILVGAGPERIEFLTDIENRGKEREAYLVKREAKYEIRDTPKTEVR